MVYKPYSRQPEDQRTVVRTLGNCEKRLLESFHLTYGDWLSVTFVVVVKKSLVPGCQAANLKSLTHIYTENIHTLLI